MYSLFSEKEFLVSYIVVVFGCVLVVCYLIFASVSGFFPFFKRVEKILNTDVSQDVYDSIVLKDIIQTKIQEGNQPATLIRENVFRVFYKYDYKITLEPSLKEFVKEGEYKWFNGNNIDTTKIDLIVPLSSFYYELLVGNKDSKKVKVTVTRTIGTSNVRVVDSSFSGLQSGEIITYIHSTRILLNELENINENVLLSDEIVV